MQDDSYLESYISTIGVDFVSIRRTSPRFPKVLSIILISSGIYNSNLVISLFSKENPHSGTGWEDH